MCMCVCVCVVDKNKRNGNESTVGTQNKKKVIRFNYTCDPKVR